MVYIYMVLSLIFLLLVFDTHTELNLRVVALQLR